ncbi:MAG: hypothetical protein B6D72_08320 [gamma proteobacterium symbiont of Ctena orbiculata]|nr:MAG: hypothetical protein B6D72_08320 [gamma proteobacterium symbiont of Ctena orbiculata]PVV18560.1 MAG: hypothetical protein B6D74_16205 [gamma proteobacterium symbiont of Ctena orbiculata]
MLKHFTLASAACLTLSLLAGSAIAEDLWTLYQPACLANGIDPDPCICILDEVVKAHGEQAARYVGLDMSMRHEEANAILAVIGEDKAFAAGSMFDIAQNRNCTSGRVARLKGSYSSSEPNAVSAAATASSIAGANLSSQNSARTVNVMTAGIPIIDLRSHDGEVTGDVSVTFGAGVDPAGGATNIRNHLGFYPVSDETGGVDTNGDGIADVKPGDPDYANKAQTYALPTKLYITKQPGREQYLGEVRLSGGALYAPFLRYRGKSAPSGLPAGFPFGANDRQKMEDFLKAGSKKPSSLYFVFAAANPKGMKHLVNLGNNQLGFEETPLKGLAERDYDDALFNFNFVAY